MKKVIKIFIILALLVAIPFAGYKIYQKLVLQKYPASIEIVLGEDIVSFNPYTFTVNNDQLLRNVYDPLVKLDSSMSIKPGLAVSYGRLDDLTWEFRLTPNASFHSGEKLTAQNIPHSFEQLQQIDNAQSLIDSIENIEVTGDYTFQIKTSYKDPVLLNKLALIPILPQKTLQELVNDPDGTGPYEYAGRQENTYILNRFENYFGPKAKYEQVRFTPIPGREQRAQYASQNPGTAMVVPFPVGLIRTIEDNRYELHRYPNLSVNFFVFNFRTGRINSTGLRQLLVKSLTDEDLLKLTDDFGKPADQFVSSGVLGFNTELDIDKYTAAELEANVKAQGFFGTTIRVALPEGLDTFAEFLETYWFNAGLRPEIDLIPLSEITDGLTQAKYDLIFLGWKSDYGEASRFIESITLPNARFNLGAYNNARVNELSTQIKEELDLTLRRDQIAEVMQIITVEDPLGIPLFESEVLFAVNNRFKYTPRADGFIEISNLKPRLAK